jgi:hypothetical protein
MVFLLEEKSERARRERNFSSSPDGAPATGVISTMEETTSGTG